MNLSQEIINDYDLLGLFERNIYSNPSDSIDEARKNSVSICFEQEDAKKYSINDLKLIVEQIINAKNQFVIDNKKDMIFYLWFDEQSKNLRYSIISDHGG